MVEVATNGILPLGDSKQLIEQVGSSVSLPLPILAHANPGKLVEGGDHEWGGGGLGEVHKEKGKGQGMVQGRKGWILVMATCTRILSCIS